MPLPGFKNKLKGGTKKYQLDVEEIEEPFPSLDFEIYVIKFSFFPILKCIVKFIVFQRCKIKKKLPRRDRDGRPIAIPEF